VRMSVPAYISLGFAIFIVIFAYVVNPDSRILLIVLPMLVPLAAIPLILNALNRRHVNNIVDIEMHRFRLCKIKDLERFDTGASVRVRGNVKSTSFKWLNRPHFLLDDGTGLISIIMFTAPFEDIKTGDRVEAVGTLRPFGLSKDKKIWGIKMKKLSGK